MTATRNCPNMRSSLRISHIITGLNVGGAERALHSILTGGLQNGLCNHVISLMGPGHFGPLLRAEGVPVTCLNMMSGRPTPGAVWRLVKAMRATSPDVLQGWMYHGNLAASLGRQLSGRDAILSWGIRQSLEGYKDLKPTTRAVIDLGAALSNAPASIVYNSARARAQHEARGYASVGGAVIANGFDSRRWAPDPEANGRLARELGLPAKTLLVGFVGRGHRDKDIPNLLSAFRSVAASHPSAHLVCVGRDIREHYGEREQGQRISYLGERIDMERILPAFDVLCLSSSFEGFPNVIGEAMACGVPCVTTDVGDAAAIVSDTGWTAPPRDSAALATALSRALSVSNVERRTRGLAARARIEAHYSLSAVVDQYRAHYMRLVEAG